MLRASALGCHPRQRKPGLSDSEPVPVRPPSQIPFAEKRKPGVHRVRFPNRLAHHLVRAPHHPQNRWVKARQVLGGDHKMDAVRFAHSGEMFHCLPKVRELERLAGLLVLNEQQIRSEAHTIGLWSASCRGQYGTQEMTMWRTFDPTPKNAGNGIHIALGTRLRRSDEDVLTVLCLENLERLGITGATRYDR